MSFDKIIHKIETASMAKIAAIILVSSFLMATCFIHRGEIKGPRFKIGDCFADTVMIDFQRKVQHWYEPLDVKTYLVVSLEGNKYQTLIKTPLKIGQEKIDQHQDQMMSKINCPSELEQFKNRTSSTIKM